MNEQLTFNELKSLSTSDGNLSAHARKLEEAGYVVYQVLRGAETEIRIPHHPKASALLPLSTSKRSSKQRRG